MHCISWSHLKELEMKCWSLPIKEGAWWHVSLVSSSVCAVRFRPEAREPRQIQLVKLHRFSAFLLISSFFKLRFYFPRIIGYKMKSLWIKVLAVTLDENTVCLTDNTLYASQFCFFFSAFSKDAILSPLVAKFLRGLFLCKCIQLKKSTKVRKSP